jgi:hypothetical protein
MKKVAVVFVLAVIVPSLVLAWLAARSSRDQQYVLERQRILLYEGLAEGIANELRTALAVVQDEFAQQVERLIGKGEPGDLANEFDRRLCFWPWPIWASRWQCPATSAAPLLDRPRPPVPSQNDAFLCSREEFR